MDDLVLSGRNDAIVDFVALANSSLFQALSIIFATRRSNHSQEYTLG
jgi:hypothetical protein